MSKHRSTRRLALAAIGGAAGTAMVGAPAVAQQAPPQAVDISTFCANAPADSPFQDTGGTVFADAITCLEHTGITAGTGAFTFEPSAQVTRAQMATFVANLIATANDLATGTLQQLPQSPPDAFTDVDESNTHSMSINQLAAAGIVTGGPGDLPSDQYGPSMLVSRAQMAAFLNGAFEFLTGEPLTTDQQFFTDVDEGNTFAADINAIAAAGISTGTDADTYDPTGNVSRGQMAAFLVRSLAVMEQQGAIQAAPAPANTSFQADLAALNGSGTMGTATVQLDGNDVTVSVELSSASPNLPHAQHIHIGGNNECPAPSADTNGDGLISTPEGVPSYGGIEVALTTQGDVSPASALAVDRMPVASADGAITYQRTFTLPAGVNADDLANGVIVSHGIADTSLGTDASTYDGPDSPLAAGVPQEATLPASCGALDPSS